MKKSLINIFSMVVLGGVLSSCTGNFEKYNTDPYALKSEDPSAIIPSMFDPLMYVQQNSSQMVDQMVGTLGGYFSLPNRWGGQNYDTFNVSDDWNDDTYNTAFTALFSNYFKVESLTEGEGHWFAFAKLLKAAGMMRVADCYGPIPYSQVKDGAMYVAYDSGEDIYKNIIADLVSAAEVLSQYAAEVGPSPLGSQDPVYSGDYSKWAKFAMSVAMRAAMRSGDKEAFISAYESTVGFIESNSDNAMINPKTQGNPYQLASSSWGDLRVNASIVDYMNGYEDSRRSAYFTAPTSGSSPFQGLRMGQPANFSKASGAPYSQPNFLASTYMPVFVAAESHFLIAEAILKGWISGDAKSEYETGIRLSFEQWGAAGAEDYIKNSDRTPGSHSDDILSGQNISRTNTSVKIAWDAESSDEKHLEQIITQKWIANYPMGLEAWAEYRRTGYPDLWDSFAGATASGATVRSLKEYRRLRYPFEEKNLNTANYNAAVAALGGDSESTPLFWSKK